MAHLSDLPATVNPANGFCSQTRTFHSLRPPAPLPPLTVTDYALSLLPPSASSSPYIVVDAASGESLTYSQSIRLAESISLHLRARFSGLSKGDVAFILLPPSLHVPIIYLSLLSLGVVFSPANPLSSKSEIAHQVRISNPSVAFATTSTASKLPNFRLGTVLVDSPEFDLVLTQRLECTDLSSSPPLPLLRNVNGVDQTDPAAILYSSGTTGRVKGVLITHRNLISIIAARFSIQPPQIDDTTGLPAEPRSNGGVCLLALPAFHIYGFFMLIKGFVHGETLILMPKFELEAALAAIDKYRVTLLPVSPPVIVALVKSELTDKYDLRSLRTAVCGGAPLGREVSERFKAKFPHIELLQGYAMTESAGGSRMIGPEESSRYGSVGRLIENMEAKVVDPATGEALLPGQKGELWLRGPCIMKGYVGDDKATAETLDSDGWLKTGDLCYFDSEGFLFIVDRLKELIKYNAYQVAPAELEHLLQSNPEIADAAVIPYPDEEAGQIPMAFVVRKPGSNISESEIIGFIARQVAPYKKVRRVAFVDSIPKNPSGKILRRELINAAVPGSKAKL